MRAQTITGVLALVSPVLAFSDSSPWVLLSTSKIDEKPPTSNQIQTSSEAMEFTKRFLSECPTEKYLIVTQPGVHAADFWTRDGCAMPHLCKAVKDARVQGRYTVSEVVGVVTDSGLAQHIKASCDKKGEVVEIIERPLQSLSGDRWQALDSRDASIAADLDMASSDSYTILFYATPRDLLYDSEFIQPLHMDMKRGLDSTTFAQKGNKTQRDTRPLFEKYQFFTPGIFMGIIVALILFSILGAGISGLASLQVSYGAFDKEMGPAAQKKQQ